MYDRFENVVYLKEALQAYTADLEMQIGSDKAQKVLERVINDFGFWHEHIASTKGSDVETEKKADLRKLKLFWDVYVEDPDFSVNTYFENPDGPSLPDRMESILASKVQTSHGDRNLHERDVAYIAEIVEALKKVESSPKNVDAIEAPFDELCIEWVRFGKTFYENLDEFLSARAKIVTGRGDINKSKFQDFLRSAGDRGIIKKKKGTNRWILV